MQGRETLCTTNNIQGEEAGESSSTQLGNSTLTHPSQDIPSESESNPSENEPLLFNVANPTSPRFHPHQLYWSNDRSSMLFFLGPFVLVFSGIGVIDNAFQVHDCDNS